MRKPYTDKEAEVNSLSGCDVEGDKQGMELAVQNLHQ